MATGAIGCIPQNVVCHQGVRGIVIDAATSKPIAGARVQTKQPFYNPNDTREDANTVVDEVRTSPDGRFFLKPLTNWWMRPLFIPADRVAGFGKLEIDADGYNHRTEIFAIGKPSVLDVRTMKLEPVGR